MSQGHDIFVKSTLKLTQFAVEMQKVLGLEFSQFRDDGGYFFHHLDAEMDIKLLQHELETDRELRFEEYPFQISVQSVNVWDAVDRERKDIEIARRLFNRLKADGRFTIMLVDNLQILLDRYDHKEGGEQ